MKATYLFLLAIFAVACTAGPSTAQSKLGPDAFEKFIKDNPGAQLIDVRTPEEFAAGHLPGARNINYYDDDFAAQMGKLDKSKPVLVYCAVGGRSGSAAGDLKSWGFTKIYDLEGGFKAWKAKGKKIN